MSARKPAYALSRLEGHKGAVNVCRYTYSGDYCMSGGEDRTIMLWNPLKLLAPAAAPPSSSSSGGSGRDALDSCLLVKSYCGAHGYAINDISISRDNERFASCGGDKTVFVWDITRGEVVRRLNGHTQRVNSVELSAEGGLLLSASYDKSIVAWDLRSNSREPIQRMEDFTDSVTKVVHTQELAGYIAGSCVDGSVRVYDLRKGCVHCDKLGTAPVVSMMLSRDEKSLLCSSLSSSLRLLEISSGLLLREYRCEGFACTGYKTEACYSHDDRTMMTGSEDGAVYSFDIVTGDGVCRTDRSPSASASASVASINGGKSGVLGVSSLVHHPSKPFYLVSYYGCATAFAFEHASSSRKDDRDG